MKKIFTGGTILTMAEDKQAEAVYIENNRIKVVGSLLDCKSAAINDYELIDLQGKCMMPGFVDSYASYDARNV